MDFEKLFPRYDSKGIETVRSAYGIAEEALKDMKRGNGAMFIEHPLEVAKIVYEERRKYFKDDLSKHAYYASWISVVVLILGRYLILIIKHYIIPFIKWIIKNGNK